MSSSPRTPRSYTNTKQKKHFQSTERRPRLLKDFLIDDSNSCSSNGFKSYPRTVPQHSSSTIEDLIQKDLNSNLKSKSKLRRSRSRAASTTISAFQAIINTVKSIHFNAVKSPSILPRSLSRRLSKRIDNDKDQIVTNKSNVNEESEIKLTVRVKDIIRWKSFRDLVEEKSPPLDSPSSPHDHCTTTTKASSSTTPSSCSNRSSWCDSDFTAEYLPSWSGNSEVFNGEINRDTDGKKYLPCVGSDSMETTTVLAAKTALGPKELPYTKKEQYSPMSVLNFEFEEDEDSFSYFNKTLENFEKTKQKCMQNIRRFESLAKLGPINLEELMSVEENNGYKGDDDFDEEEEEEECDEIDEDEEKAISLLSHIKATSSTRFWEDNFTEEILLDFIRNELSTKKDTIKNNDTDNEIIKQAKAWTNGEYNPTNGKETCAVLGDMEKRDNWKKYGDEQEELGLSLEKVMLNILVDEVLDDLLSC